VVALCASVIAAALVQTENLFTRLSPTVMTPLYVRLQEITLPFADQVSFLIHHLRCLLLSFLPLGLRPFRAIPADRNPVVLVTGTSTGIGRHLVFDLLQEGYTVFATVRKDLDKKSLLLEASKLGFAERLHIVFLDMNKLDSFDATVAEISTYCTSKKLEFAALINNAGYATIRPVELTDEDTMMRAFNTNLVGAVELTRRFVPLLRKHGGRIVNMGSVASWINPPWYGSYGGSKASLRAWNIALRREIAPFGVAVSLVEPGIIQTPGPEKTLEELEGHTSNSAVQKIYPIKGQQRTFNMAKAAIGTEHVSRSVFHALSAEWPLPSYLIGWDARLYALGFWLLDESLVDILIANVFAQDPWWQKQA